ncbi:hypothetical protein [Serratia fonticola]|uniref:hypothetical protein n=1 Tax=Serratia fonticola TaxID=47917 RepID=UPI000BA1EEF9|nr:hypothetical protein [Serratia fonticola]PAA98766.1 hypothetical protein CJJ13_04860 [Serratia fonticola]
MRELPQYGERYRHHQGRTVRILNLQRVREAISRLNPEFAYEVIFEYESSGKVTTMPLAWFVEVYTKITEAPPLVTGRLDLSRLPSSVKVVYCRRHWSAERPLPQHDDTHYSRYL